MAKEIIEQEMKSKRISKEITEQEAIFKLALETKSKWVKAALDELNAVVRVDLKNELKELLGK